MSNYRFDPRKQFSKRLARWTSIFWFFYMTWLSCVIYLQPQSALYCVYMGMLVTSVMLLNVWAYTKNSIYEKGVFAMLDKTKLSLNIGPGKSSDEEANSNNETEGESNG